MSNLDKLYNICIKLALRMRKEKGDDVLPPLLEEFNKLLIKTNGNIDEESLKKMVKHLTEVLEK